MKLPRLRCLSLFLCLLAVAAPAVAHPGYSLYRVRTRAEAHFARGLRLMDRGQLREAARELELARRHGDAVIVQEATWALQDLGIDHRSVPMITDDAERERIADGRRSVAGSGERR